MRHENSKNGRKGLITVVALVLLLCAAVGGTLAWMTAETPAVTNTFTPAHVTCWVDEDFNGTTKSDVKIKNTGDIDAYIREAIVVNWADASGNVSGTPVTVNDYTMTLNLNSSGWVEGTDGYYYYTSPVSPEDSTFNLIDTCEPVEGQAPDGYKLQVTILAEAIQSTPDTAIKEAWGVDPSTWTRVTTE